ncbi:MAG: hypothetical protein PVH17_06250 [Anaerolineae bacterium]|jgi:hypothetical protein
MEHSLAVVFVISLAGMTLLFLALGFFYGLLSLLTSATQDRALAPEDSAEPQVSAVQDEAALRAAAIAVALARADAEQKAGAVSTPAEAVDGWSVSPWWALYHQQRLARNSEVQRPQ